MAIGYFIGLGDKTGCGGKVLDANTSMMMFGFARLRRRSSFLRRARGNLPDHYMRLESDPA